MAYDAQNGGVYIVINGDATPLRRQLDELKRKVSQTAKEIESEFQGTFGRADISRAANSSISSFARLRTSVRAINTDLQGHQREWVSLGRQIGLTNEQAQKLATTINTSVKEQNIRTVESSLRSLQRQTGMATSEIIKLAREMGAVEVAGRKAFSELGIRSAAQIRNEIKGLSLAYYELKKSGTATARDLERAQTAMRQRVVELRNELNGISPVANTAYGSLSKIGLAAAGIAAVTASIKTLIDAMVEMDSIKVAYQSIFGLEDKTVGTAQLSYIYDLTQKLGLEFKATAESAKGFFAASKGTSLETDIHRIFEGFTSAASALHLSSDRVKGVFTALSQMVSKGKVSMEELRQQLGEHLPGAFKDAAASMGMTVQEFDKMVSSGSVFAEDLLPKWADYMQNKWGPAAVEASGSVQSALNRLSNDWTVFKANLLNSDAVKKGIEGVNFALNSLNSVIKTLGENREILYSVLSGAGAAAGIALIAKYGASLLTLASNAKTAAMALGSFLVTNPWVAVAAAIGTTTAALTFFAQKADTATQAQKALTAAQEAAVSANKILNDQARATLKQAEEEYKSIGLQYEALVQKNEDLMKSLAESIHTEFVPGLGEARAETDRFTYALEEAAKQASNTGDYEELQRQIRDIQAKAQAAGQETKTFSTYVEQLQAICSKGVQINVALNGFQKTMDRLLQLIRVKRELGDSYDPNTPIKENNALKSKVANIETRWMSTKPGKKEGYKGDIESLKKLRSELSALDDKKMKELGYTSDELKTKIKHVDDVIADTNSKIEGLSKSTKKTGKSAHSAAIKAANAQGTYNTSLENTIKHIESLREQLKLDSNQTVAQKKIDLERKYAETLRKTNEQIEKQIRSGSISAEQGKKLQTLKAEENSLELQVKLRELETKAIEESLSHLQEQISFYNELGEISGSYTNSIELQNKVIDIQAQKYRELKTIPSEMINEWTKWKKLQNSVDPFDGAYRGLLRFHSEFTNSSKKWEDLTYNFCKDFEKSSKDMFDDFLETGKLSFSSFEQLFKQLLKDLAYYALVQPIVLSMVGGNTTGSSADGTSNGTGANIGVGSATSQVANSLFGAAQSFVISKAVEPIKDYAAGAVNSAAASLFPSTFAASAEQAAANAEMNAVASMYVGSTTAPIASASTSAPTQTLTGSLSSATSGVSGIATMGAGIIGSALGNYVIAPALGINTSSTGSQIGGMVGGMGGALAGAQIGAMAGSWGGPIGAGIGALVGTIGGLLAGGVFGGGEDLEPGYYINAYTDLTSKKGLKGYKKGTYIQNHRWDGFPESGATAMKDQVARPLMEQMRKTTADIKTQLVSVGGKELGESFFASVRKNQKNPTKNKGKNNEPMSEYFAIHGEWSDTTSPDVQEWAKKVGKKYQEVMVKSIASMDMSAITKASDGFVANTEEEIAQALIKAGSLIAIGDSIDDEELQETFRKGISKSLISALKKINTKKLGLNIDKSSLEGWTVAAQAMQTWAEVNTTIEGMLNPASEIAGQFKSIGEQFASWEGTLAGLGWQTKKIKEIDKKRIEYVKKYADEVMKGFETQDEVVAHVKEINDAFNDVANGLKTNGITGKEYKDVSTRRDAVLREYIDGIFSQFGEKNEFEENIKSIKNTFASAIDAMKEASDTFTKSEIKNAEKLRDAEIKRQKDAVRSSVYESINSLNSVTEAKAAFNDIAKSISEIIDAMKAAPGAFSAKEMAAVEKKGSALMRQQAKEMLSQYDSLNDIEQSFVEVSTYFTELSTAMKSVKGTFSEKDIQKAEKKRSEILRQQAKEMLAQYDSMTESDSVVFEITDHFNNLTKAMQSAKDVFSASDIEAVQKKSSGIIRQQISDMTKQYDVISDAESNLVGISTYFAQIISTLKSAPSVFSNKDIAAVQKKSTDAMRRYVASVTDSYKKTTNLKAATTQTAKIFNELIAAMKKVGMSVEEVTAVEKLRAQELRSIRSEAVKGYNQDLDIRYNTLKNGADTDTTALLSLWYSQNNELKKVADDIGQNTQQYQITVQVQQAEYLQKQIEVLQKQLKTMLQDQLTAATDALNNSISLKNTFQSLVKSLRSALKNLWTTESNLTGTRYSEAYKDFNSTYQKAMSGDTDALNELPDIGQNVLSLGREQLRTRQEYDTAFYDISKKIKKASDYAQEQLSVYEKEEARQQALVDSINEKIAAASGSTASAITGSVESIQALISQYQARLTQLLEDISKNTNIISDNVVVLKSLNDGSESSTKAILETKAQLMKYGETIGNRQLTQAELSKYANMTSDDVLRAIEENGLTFDEWYQKYGVKEFDVAAKNTGITVKSIEDLKKITDAYDNLLVQKANALNSQMVSSAKVAAGGWTAQKVLEAINKSGLTVTQWYEQFGRAEGFVLNAAATTNEVLLDLEEVLKESVIKLNDGTTSSKQAILDAKSQFMKYGEGVSKYQKEHLGLTKIANLTSDEVLKSIEDAGLSFDDWYAKYGSKEIIEAAKNTGVTVKSIEDLRKISEAYDRLLTQKADTLNASLYTTSKVAAGGWTADLVRQEINSRGMTVKEWYEKYGKSEGYLLNIFGESKLTTNAINNQTAALKQSILGLNNGSVSNKNAILETKAQLMKYGEALSKAEREQGDLSKIANTTSANVLANIEKSGKSFDDWYAKYGSKEILEAAKNTGITVNSIEDLKSVVGVYETLLAKKADTLNASLYTTSKVAAGGWTADLVRQEINSRGMTVKEWYDKYGRSEGFLLGINNGTNSVKTAIQEQTTVLQKSILSLNDGSTASKNAILATKAALEKYGEAIGKKELEQEGLSKIANTTSANILNKIDKAGLTFNDWYTKYGSKEIAEAAKNTGVTVSSINDLSKIINAYENLLAKKADVLNTSLYTTSKVAAGGWTSDLVREEINSRGMTVKEWYEKYGKSEGFLLNTSTNTRDTSTNTANINNAMSAYSDSQVNKILEIKAALMNMGDAMTKAQAAMEKSWTSESVLKEIQASGLSFSEWAEKYGEKELSAAAKKYGYSDISKFTDDLLSGKVGKNITTQTTPSTTTKTTTPTVTTTTKTTTPTTTTSPSTKTTTTTPTNKTTTTTKTTTTKPSENVGNLSSTLKAALQTKADAMRQGYLLGNGQTMSDSWTPATVLAAINAKGFTAQQWYDQYGKKEIQSLQTKTTSSTKYSSDYALLVAKADALNKSKYGGKTNWRAATVLQDMQSRGQTLAVWYTKYGKKEGFASGGVTPKDTPFWVGERGPELMMSPKSYGVINNKDSISLMRGLFNSSNSNKDIVYFLVKETNNILRQALRKIDQLEYDTHRNRLYMQKWDNDGLPATAAY